MRRGYSILTIYGHALKPYIKLPDHMPKYQTHRKEATLSKQVKRTVTQYRQYCATVLNAYFEQVSVKKDSQTVYVQLTTVSQDSLQILQKGTQSS